MGRCRALDLSTRQLPHGPHGGLWRRPRIAQNFRDPVFWAGFAWTAGIIGWNIINFWFPNVPRITLFDSINTKSMTVAQSFPPVYLRVLPLVIGLGYLCSLDLLFSFWFFGLLAVVKMGVINRTGFTVGLEGQVAKGGEIVNLESHGAMTVLVVWSVWIARRHLIRVAKTALNGDRGDGPISYRFAVVGLIISCYISVASSCPWACRYSLPLSICC